ncbi:MAG: thioesterase [Actinobacteria bacterium]|nr:thioesterase [Actinomycetota bacterium]
MTKNTPFYSALIHMYEQAPVNQPFEPKLQISDGAAQLEIPVSQDHFHSGGALHGAIIFKLLDDSAFFAAQSKEQAFFLVTASFNIEFIRPVKQGPIMASAHIKSISKSRIIAESTLYNTNKKTIAFGTGTFMKSNITLNSI